MTEPALLQWRQTERLAGTLGQGSAEAEGIGIGWPPSFSQDRAAALSSTTRAFRWGQRRGFEAAAAAAAATPAMASSRSQRLSICIEHSLGLIADAHKRWQP